MEKSNIFNRIYKTLRKMLYFAFPFFTFLVAWRSNFEYVKGVLLKVLSEDTVYIIRILLQYSLGTQSVAMSLQLLISYSFIFISISSCTLFVINIVRLVLVIIHKVGTINDGKKYQPKSNKITHVNTSVYLNFSKLNI